VGINPNNDGERIRLIVPPLTQVIPAAGQAGLCAALPLVARHPPTCSRCCEQWGRVAAAA
jgi:hypothetical protein